MVVVTAVVVMVVAVVAAVAVVLVVIVVVLVVVLMVMEDSQTRFRTEGLSSELQRSVGGERGLEI